MLTNEIQPTLLRESISFFKIDYFLKNLGRNYKVGKELENANLYKTYGKNKTYWLY